MATIRWVGGAAAIANVKTWTFAGTWVVGEKITVTIGQKAWAYTLASTVIATFGAALTAAYEALSATTYPELAEQTATFATATMTLTADTAGKPFSATISTDSAAGTINAVAAPNSSSAGTQTVANQGPQSAASLKNYSGGALPANGDTLIYDFSEDEILYDLDALSAVTLLMRRTYASFEGEIGLPLINTDGSPYPEYRPRYMVCSVTTDFIGEGEGDGSSRLMFDYSTIQATINVFQSSSGEDDLKAVLIKGTNASNVLNITRGSVAVAQFGGEVSNILTLNMSFESDVANDADVYFGAGVTFGTGSKDGGTLEINSAVVTALTQTAGGTIINGTGAVASLQVQGGTIIYNTTGTLGGATVVAGDGVLNFNMDKRAKTVTNAIDRFGENSQVLDDNKVVTTLIVDYNNITVPGWGKNLRLSRTAVA